MSVFKKLVGFLFEEEEDLEDDELEDFSFLEEKEEEPLPKEIVNIRRPKAREVKETPQHHSAVSEASFGQPAAKETKFTSIEVSEQEAPKRTQAPKERIVGSKRNVKRSEPIRKEFEFTPVISPIFGVDEETENTRSGSPKVDIPPLRATIATTPKKNPLGTVLSPMYGANELEEFEEEAKTRLENESEAKYAMDGFDDVDEVEIAYDDEEIDETEIVRVPLEELLSNEEQSEQSDDLLQFSLFGDDETISTEKAEDTYTIKE